MGKLAGKVIEAPAAENDRYSDEIGPALRRLRELSELSQKDMAKRLSVQQAAVSKIERGGDVHLSTIRKYVEALGASLRIDAAFPTDAPISLQIRDAFDVEIGNENQFVLPLIGDDQFRSHRDIVLSIRPQYSEKIVEGRKTVELRRRFPLSAPRGTIAYIYSTSPIRAMVGAAEIRDVLKLPVRQIWDEFEQHACIEKHDFDKYFEGLEYGYVLLFEDAKPFVREIPLEELRSQFGFEPPQSFLYAKHDLRRALKHESAIVSH